MRSSETMHPPLFVSTNRNTKGVGNRYADEPQLVPVAQANRHYSKCKDQLRHAGSDSGVGSEDKRSPGPVGAESRGIVPSEKRVRFRFNADASVRAEIPTRVESPPTIVLTEEDIVNLWYTDQECSDIELRADERTSFFLATNGLYHAAMEQLITSCLERYEKNNLTWQVFRASKEEPTQNSMLAPNEALRLVVDPEVRGLEYQTVGVLSSTLESCCLYRSYRDIHVCRVLDCQEIWRNDSSLTTNQKATLLAQRARQYSGVSVIFARLLADGDAETAIEDNSLSDDENAPNAKDMEEQCCSPSPTTVIDVPIGFGSDEIMSEILEKLSIPFDCTTRS